MYDPGLVLRHNRAEQQQPFMIKMERPLKRESDLSNKGCSAMNDACSKRRRGRRRNNTLLSICMSTDQEGNEGINGLDANRWLPRAAESISSNTILLLPLALFIIYTTLVKSITLFFSTLIWIYNGPLWCCSHAREAAREKDGKWDGRTRDGRQFPSRQMSKIRILVRHPSSLYCANSNRSLVMAGQHRKMF